MNLPNKLTILRIALVPFFVAAMLINFPFRYLAALVLFAVASLTDMLDGKIARKYGLVTNFGKFMDPLADKVLVMAALICFIPCFGLSAVAVIIIMAREFLVTSVRLMAAKDGTVVAASFWGKFKTVMQMVSIIFMLVALEWESWQHTVLEGVALPAEVFSVPLMAGYVLVWVAVVLTIVSGVQYFWQFRHLMSEK